jgi:hypothetical protein
LISKKSREQKNAHQRARYKSDLEFRKRKHRDRTKTAKRRYKRDAGYRETLKARSRRGRGVPDPLYPKPQFCERPGCTRAPDAVDHDHNTGQFRGWLCFACNTGLGMFGDSADGMRGAIQYLERARGY